MGLSCRFKAGSIGKIVIVSCFFAALLAGLAGCGNMVDDIKYTAKMMLRGHVDPSKLDTGLPVIKINTYKRQAITSKERYIDADIEIIDPNNSGNNLPKTGVEIRGRGNSTWKANKKPYRIRFLKKTALFGYEKARSWVLLANNQDTTLILNTIAFELGIRIGFPFANHCTHAELVLNGRYEGSYVITEQVQVGRGRVDIDEETGFLVELGSYDEEPKFQSSILELPIEIKHPEDLADDSGYALVKNAVNEFEAALFAATFPDNGYRDLIDMDNFADYLLINEITRNEDLQIPHSVYLYRDGKDDARIKPGPLWDFDVGFDFDIHRGVYFNDAAGMFYNTVFRDEPGRIFFNRFFEDPRFRAKYKERWNRHYAEFAGMEAFIDQIAAKLEKSRLTDRKVWWWKKGDPQEEIKRMKDWWRRRIEYLNTEINKF
ncbi:MAG: CotH kinase family protein [Treponema sp.]|jgi:spore coat protein CotH|nr:CotH kinase family protein [Treponema sp.]